MIVSSTRFFNEGQMSTKFRAWLVGAAVGSVAVSLVNQRIIEPQQKSMLLSLRQALLTPEVRAKHAREASEQPEFPLLSRETLNLALIAISDRFIFQQTSEKSE